MLAARYIEFLGGPFDGHCQRVSLEPEELAGVALLPVSRTVFGWLEGQAQPVETRVTSVAVYHLELTGAVCRYRFHRSVAPAVSQRRIAS